MKMIMKTRWILLALCMALVLAPMASIGVLAESADGYTYDEGTKTYTVTTADGLLAVAAAINAGATDSNVTLAADIDLTGKTWVPIGTSKAPYEGTFDGGNFTISNLNCIVDYQKVGAAGYCALIGKAYDGCTVKNLKFTGATVQGVEFSALVISETAQKATDVLDKKVLIENVHIRNSDIKGSNGWGTEPATPNKNEYTGALIGKAAAYYTEVLNCSVVATITSECRTAGLIGGEAVGSSITTAGITIRNCVVGGAIAQEKIPSGSNATKAGGAAGLVGYHAAFSVTVDNCLVAAPVSAKHGTAGAISFQSDRLTLDACNVIVVDHVVGKVVNVTLGTVQLQDVFAYKSNSTETALAIAANVGDAGAAAVKLNGVDSTWAEATIPVISTKADLNTKLAAIFAGNSVITAAVLEEVVGHDHAYTQEIVDAKYLKSEATCTEPATYYKSCTCGIFDAQITFTFGEPKAHTPSEAWRDDENNHWHVCSSCLENKTDEAAHTFGEWEVTKPATEVRQGERSKTCTVCGYKVTEKIDKLAPQTAENTSAATNEPTTATGGCGASIAGLGTVIGLILGMGVTVLKKKG